ncbi:hypothetical protein TNCV_3761661 [Trichonephila clavipes]|nr:hypothetical protein TNCV_3761661 [Trichonephila clavipes]
MATANDMDLTQNGFINNVFTYHPHLPDSYSYAIWARKLSIVPATSDEYTATSAELGNINNALLAAKERMNLPLFRLPISIEALDALIKKVEEQRAHLTPVNSTPKVTVPSDTTLNSPSKRTLKNLRLKTDKKRLMMMGFKPQTKEIPQRKSIANDEGVDEEFLARAFRAALPALRKLSHPDDKACEIFQAYVALKNGRNYVAHNSA